VWGIITLSLRAEGRPAHYNLHYSFATLMDKCSDLWHAHIMDSIYRKQTAFSLVELSIVLVILGLLVGGVLSGQALIRASEMRSITAQANQYRAAIYSFRDKYFAIPGDMANARR
jgi:prepilin-type N-terminal cleavage/methylation domain-containing protein